MPARNEVATIRGIVEGIRTELCEHVELARPLPNLRWPELSRVVQPGPRSSARTPAASSRAPARTE
jgi:hypothetical protein